MGIIFRMNIIFIRFNEIYVAYNVWVVTIYKPNLGNKTQWLCVVTMIFKLLNTIMVGIYGEYVWSKLFQLIKNLSGLIRIQHPYNAQAS